MSNTKRVALVVASLVVAVAIGGTLVVQSKHAAYVRETIAILPEAEKAYADGRFADAAKTVAQAVERHKANPTWFAPADEAKVVDLSTFLTGQQAIWTQVEATKSRAALEKLFESARSGLPRAQPLLDRIKPQLETALTQERDGVVSAAGKLIPEARKAYEQGTWDTVLAHVAAIRTSLETLPQASREAAARLLDKDLKPVEALAAAVATMRSIKGAKDDGALKADKLRGLIGALPEPQGRDAAFRRALLQLIGEVDPETRAPIVGIKLRSSNRKKLVDAFTQGGGLVTIGDPDDLTVIELQGPVHRYALRVAGDPAYVLIEVDRVRLQFAVDLVNGNEAAALATATELSRALRATHHPRVLADEAWVVHADAPGRCVVNASGQQAWLCLDGRIFVGKVTPEGDVTEQVERFLQCTRDLETAVRNSASIPDEIKGPVAALLKASHSRAPPNDYLDGEFCRQAVYAGYLEAQIPTLDADVAARLKKYKSAYEILVRFRPRIEARSSDNATILHRTNLEGDSSWCLIDAKTTTFATPPRDHMGSDLVVHSVFAGQHDEFPAGEEPIEIRMSHGLAGIVARWSAATAKLEFDPIVWSKALGQTMPEHFVGGDWQIPPHALKVDARGQARELILPAGSLPVAPFPGEKRREAQEKFLQLCSERMRSPGELHLFFRYFVQYVLDSPVTTATTLIGSSKHTGDMHQDAFQTLDRWINGRFLTDCDDLAEVYWNICRRQGRLAYVLGAPSHATCGVVEKAGDGWVFFCVDTGPPRQLKGADLDKVVEKLLRTYDDDGSMAFDPRQMQFLFRFAGEQTRTDYYLDSRMLRDAAYADVMIRVQEYWHFGFYALGIETMSKVLETDKMPANCSEISGLYSRVGMHADALKWIEVGIQGLDPKDPLSRLSETQRLATCLRDLKRADDAHKALKAAGDEITAILKSNPREGNRYRRLKFQVAAALATNGHPWDGWALVGKDVGQLVSAGVAAEALMAMVTQIFSEMVKLQREGITLAESQARDMERIDQMLKTYQQSGLFKSEDSHMELMRKYAQLFSYRLAIDGPEKAFAELVKPEYPTDKRRHTARRDPTAELDWQWMRLTPFSYAVASGHALDKDNKNAGGAKEAIAIIRAMEAALPEIRRQGSLGTIEFSVMDLELLRACLEMDEKGIRAVFDEMKRQAWGDLYDNLSRTLGRAAANMTVVDFEKVFRMYCEYGVPRRHFYHVVYAASGADARDHALAASKICLERFPDDADMRREHEQLKKLGK